MKAWKMAAIGGALAASAVYIGSLAAFMKFFCREKPNGKEFEEFCKYIDGSPYREWLPKIREAREWLLALPHEDVYITSEDGLSLHARYFANPNSNGRTVIFSHGYKSSCEHDFSIIVPRYWDQGYNMLMPDQRSHGESEGQYICFGTKEMRDFEGWCRYIVKRQGEDARYVLHGMSMGASVALLAAGLPEVQRHLLGVVADSGFTSPYNQFVHMAKDCMHVPTFVLSVLEGICANRAGFRFHDASTEEALRKVNVPVLLIHGEGDNFVLAENSRKNFDACAAEKKWLIIVPKAGHGFGYFGAVERCEEALKTFWDSLEPSNA